MIFHSIVGHFLFFRLELGFLHQSLMFKIHEKLGEDFKAEKGINVV